MNPRWALVAVSTILLGSGVAAGLRAQEPSKKARDAAELLRPSYSSSDDYNSIDWKALPPWQQTSFYNVRAKGQLFVFVVDCSGSMDSDDRLLRAKRELRKTVQSLQYPQRFLVIFYNDRPIPMPGSVPTSAETAAKDQMNRWLTMIEADGETDPRAAMGMALGLRPDAVFLLSDGEYPDGAVEAIAKKNPRKVPIHCIDLAGGAAGDHLKRIAKASGGQYASRP